MKTNFQTIILKINTGNKDIRKYCMFKQGLADPDPHYFGEAGRGSANWIVGSGYRSTEYVCSLCNLAEACRRTHTKGPHSQARVISLPEVDVLLVSNLSKGSRKGNKRTGTECLHSEDLVRLGCNFPKGSEKGNKRTGTRRCSLAWLRLVAGRRER